MSEQVVPGRCAGGKTGTLRRRNRRLRINTRPPFVRTEYLRLGPISTIGSYLYNHPIDVPPLSGMVLHCGIRANIDVRKGTGMSILIELHLFQMRASSVLGLRCHSGANAR